MARFCQIKIWDKLTLIKRMHLQHCLPTAKKQLAASLSPYCLHPSLSSPPDSAGQTPPWGAVQSAALDEPCGGGRVGLLLSILRTCVWETKRNLILETYFYFLEEKSPVNIFKGCQLWSGLFCAFQSKTVFSGCFLSAALKLLAASSDHRITFCKKWRRVSCFASEWIFLLSHWRHSQ